MIIVALSSCNDEVALMQKEPFGIELSKKVKSGCHLTYTTLHSPTVLNCSIFFRNGVLDKVVAEVILNKTCQSSRLWPCLSGDFFSIFSAPAVYRFGYLEVFVLYVLINMSLVIMASKIIAELKDV